MVKQRFILESTFNKIIYIVIYFTVLLLILIIYLALMYLKIGWAQYITVLISITLSILIILYRERIVRYINSIYIDYKIKRLKKKSKKNLQKTMKELSGTFVVKEKKRLKKENKVIDKTNIEKLKKNVKKMNRLFKKKEKYIEIK